MPNNYKDNIKGVYKKYDRYQSIISFKGKLIYIGTFNTVQEAANAYDEKALILFGKDAYTNANYQRTTRELKTT